MEETPNTLFFDAVTSSIKEGKKVKIRVKGQSMQPFLVSERDCVLLSPISVNDLKRYDLVLVQLSRTFWVLHRIIDIKGNRIILMGDGNTKATERCTCQQVIAKVTYIYRKTDDNPISVDSSFWRFYSFVWLHLRPLRRLLLALYRRWPW